MPEVLKKMEETQERLEQSYETGKSEMLERVEELSQELARVSAENQSTRAWFRTRLQSLWDNNDRRDEATGNALKHIVDNSVCQHVCCLREFGEKLDLFFKDSPGRAQTPLALTTRLSPPRTTSPPTTPTAVLDEASKKRPAEDNDDSEAKKRRKVGEQ